MTRLLIDTNILIDLLGKREPFYSCAAQLFSLADKKKVQLSVSSLSFATAYYIISKSHKSYKVREFLRKLKILVRVLALNDKIVELALNDSAFEDFEDGLIYHTAIENTQEIIITRNLKDFKKSKLPVMNADEYLISISN